MMLTVLVWSDGPIPNYLDLLMIFHAINVLLDPMGSSAPKLVVAKGTINAVTVAADTSNALFCDAQAHPTPKFR